MLNYFYFFLVSLLTYSLFFSKVVGNGGNVMKMFFVKWLFENEDVARKAITKAIDDGEVATSFGVGDEQYQGYDFAEGEIIFAKYRIGDRELCLVDWQAEAQELDNDYWLSPYCFEDAETFGVDGKGLRGEDYDFGVREAR